MVKRFIILFTFSLFISTISSLYAIPQEKGSLAKIVGKKAKADTSEKSQKGSLKSITEKNLQTKKQPPSQQSIKPKILAEKSKTLEIPKTEPEESSSLLYIIIGALALVVIVLIMRKGGKEAASTSDQMDTAVDENSSVEEDTEPDQEPDSADQIEEKSNDKDDELINKNDLFKTEIGYYDVPNVDGPKTAILNKTCAVLNIEGIKEFYLINEHSATLSGHAFYIAMALGYDLSTKKAVKNVIANNTDEIIKTYEEIIDKMVGKSWEAFIDELLKTLPEKKRKEAEQIKIDEENEKKQEIIDIFDHNSSEGLLLTREKDEFENKERVVVTLPTRKPEILRQWSDYLIWSLVCDIKDGNQLFAFHLLAGADDWYFFKKEDGLAFITDSAGTIKLSSLEPDRQTKEGGKIQEYLIYPVTVEQLTAIIETKNEIRYRLQFNKGREHLDDVFPGLQLYLNYMLNELGIDNSLPDQFYLHYSSNELSTDSSQPDNEESHDEEE